jgi:hypothetical protein
MFPIPQVPERARRRTYTAKYKRDILTEYDSLDRQGRGAMLRRPVRRRRTRFGCGKRISGCRASWIPHGR